MRPRPGQLDLAGNVTPPERVNPQLAKHGFRHREHDGLVRYYDPFRPQLALTLTAARKLLSERMAPVAVGGFRVRFPQSSYSQARISHRRATKEGAWHEMVAQLGTAKAPPGCWIIDGATNERVWPPVEHDPPKVEADLPD